MIDADFIMKVVLNINKELLDLHKLGIKFKNSTSLDNIIFYTKDKSFEVSQRCFFGYSRLCYITDTSGKDHIVKHTPVTDKDWFNNYMKPIILKQLL